MKATRVWTLLMLLLEAIALGCKAKGPSRGQDVAAVSAVFPVQPWDAGILPPYTDAEASALAAAAARVVPNGQTRPRDAVLRTLGISPTKLRDRWVSSLMNTTVEKWALSPGYDVSWRIADENLISREDCPIYDVKVAPRNRPPSR